MKLGRSDEEYPGWIWVSTQGGNEGWAPEQYLEKNEGNTEATAIETYSARELDTQVGDRLELLQELNGWVLVQNLVGVIGWVPCDTTTSA